jgi:hypothetical protein
VRLTLHSIAFSAAAAASMLLPGTGIAGTVGYAGTCGASQAAFITAAGHAAVPVATYTAAAIAGLDGLVVNECSGRFATNAAINARVAAGMALVVTDRAPPLLVIASSLPGLASLDAGTSVGYDVNFPAGSPILNGPAGVLTNTSLDGTPFCFPFPGGPPICFPMFFPSYIGSVASASLPTGSRVLATAESATQATAFSYAYGRGRVVYSTIPTDFPFGGGVGPYATNLIAWAVPSFTSCAAESYSGTKLTLCRQVCESHYPTTTLNALIRTWIAVYHEEPPCAR